MNKKLIKSRVYRHPCNTQVHPTRYKQPKTLPRWLGNRYARYTHLFWMGFDLGTIEKCKAVNKSKVQVKVSPEFYTEKYEKVLDDLFNKIIQEMKRPIKDTEPRGISNLRAVYKYWEGKK